MRVVKFNKNKHFTAMLECLAARQAYRPLTSEMPKIGYIAIEGEKLIATAFLRKVEGGHGMLDGVSSNPTATSAQRHQGIDLVFQAVVNKAKEMGLPHLIGMSRDAGTIERSHKYGFKKSLLAVMVVDLKQEKI